MHTSGSDSLTRRGWRREGCCVSYERSQSMARGCTRTISLHRLHKGRRNGGGKHKTAIADSLTAPGPPRSHFLDAGDYLQRGGNGVPSLDDGGLVAFKLRHLQHRHGVVMRSLSLHVLLVARPGEDALLACNFEASNSEPVSGGGWGSTGRAHVRIRLVDAERLATGRMLRILRAFAKYGPWRCVYDILAPLAQR